jgi:hypothetical protein
VPEKITHIISNVCISCKKKVAFHKYKLSSSTVHKKKGGESVAKLELQMGGVEFEKLTLIHK